MGASNQSMSWMLRLTLLYDLSLFQVWHDFTIFLIAYSVTSFIYRQILVAYDFQQQRQLFELLCIYADRFSSSIPLTFLTGFYVTQVVIRWWEQFMALPWPDQTAFKLLAFVPENVSLLHRFA